MMNIDDKVVVGRCGVELKAVESFTQHVEGFNLCLEERPVGIVVECVFFNDYLIIVTAHLYIVITLHGDTSLQVGMGLAHLCERFLETRYIERLVLQQGGNVILQCIAIHQTVDEHSALRF